MPAAAKPRRLEYVALDDLTPHPDNPKGHDPSLAAAIDRFGYTIPVLIDERTGLLAAGHGRRDRLIERRALGDDPPEGIVRRRDGTWLVPAVRGWSSENDDELIAYVIADNQQTMLGGWLPELAPLLDNLRQTESGLDGVGFTSDDVDRLLAALPKSESGGSGGHPDDDSDEPPADPVTKPGDVWQLGPHRLICGNSSDPKVVDKLLDGAVVNVAVTSPPYADRRDYDESSGFVPIHPDRYVEWFAPFAANVARVLAADGSWFVNINAGGDGLDHELYVYDLAIAHAREWGWHLVDEFCWERPGFPKRVRYRFKNAWESVFHFARGEFVMRPEAVAHASEVAIIPAGSISGSLSTHQGGSGTPHPSGGSAQAAERRGRSALDEWQGTPGFDVFDGARVPGLAYPSNRLPTFSGSHEATGHGAAYPVGLPQFFIEAYSEPGAVVLDPFAGSGSTLLAAHRSDRVGYGVELSPGYCDVICARWQRHTGEQPKRRGKRVDFGVVEPESIAG